MNEILIAVLIVGITGLFFGIVLGIAAHVFAVKEDKKTVRILAALPGANCGGCGYSGCAAYAKAVSSGEAVPSLCAVGGEASAKAIGDILGTKVEMGEQMRANVACRGTPDVTGKKYHYAGVTSCSAVSMLGGGDGLCDYGCLGYGDCERVCNLGAIKVINGVARVDERLCGGCRSCVAACPRKIISMIPKSAKTAVLCSNADKGVQTRKTCTGGCIACKKCEKECPSGAIKIENNRALIDYSKCSSCGHCVEICVSHVIYQECDRV